MNSIIAVKIGIAIYCMLFGALLPSNL